MSYAKTLVYPALTTTFKIKTLTGKPQDPNAPQPQQNPEEPLAKENQPENQVIQPANPPPDGNSDNQEQGPNDGVKDDARDDHVNDEEIPRDSSLDLTLVTYIDPDTGEIVQKPAEDVPDGAEIIDDFWEGEEEEEGEGEGEGEELGECGEDGEAAEALSSDRKQKSVKFKLGGKGRKNREANAKQNKPSGEFGESFQEQQPVRTRWSSFPKTAVVPVYEAYVPGGLLQRRSKDELNVSPLTIFALAKNRRQNEAKRNDPDYRYSKKKETLARKQQPREMYVPREKWEEESFGSSDDDYLHLMEEIGMAESEFGKSTNDSHRPPSVKRTGGDMMKWCVQALRKSKSPVFPPKPRRPDSSPSSTSSRTRPKGKCSW